MGYHLILCGDPITLCGDVYNPVLVMTFLEWLSGYGNMAVYNPAPCVRPRCVNSVFVRICTVLPI